MIDIGDSTIQYGFGQYPDNSACQTTCHVKETTISFYLIMNALVRLFLSCDNDAKLSENREMEHNIIEIANSQLVPESQSQLILAMIIPTSFERKPVKIDRIE